MANPEGRSIRIGNYVYRLGNCWTMSAEDYFRERGEADAEFLDGHRGQKFHPNEIQPTPPHIPTATETDPDLSSLEFTDEQIQILALFANGLMRADIMKRGIPGNTVDYQKTRVREKVRAISGEKRDPTALAVAHLVRKGIIKYIEPADTRFFTSGQTTVADFFRRGFTRPEVIWMYSGKTDIVDTCIEEIKDTIGAKTHLEMVAKLAAAEKLEK